MTDRRMSIEELDAQDYCYLTTTGRVTGLPREIEIWFALRDGRLYMLSGGRDRSHWVKNIKKTPAVSLRIGDEHLHGTARVLDGGDEDRLARRLLVEKYRPRDSSDLNDWGRTSLPVVVDLQAEAE